jgi:hypothetical protein
LNITRFIREMNPTRRAHGQTGGPLSRAMSTDFFVAWLRLAAHRFMFRA